MKYVVCAIAIAMTVSTSAPAAAREGAPRSAYQSQSGQPPLIDREVFFGNPEISSATLSPDGKYVAFRKPWNETLNIWVKKIGDPFHKATRITAETKRPIPSFFFSHDSKYVLFVQDQGGDENFNVYAVNPSDPPAPGKDVPAARNLTDAKGARAIIYNLSLIHISEPTRPY